MYKEAVIKFKEMNLWNIVIVNNGRNLNKLFESTNKNEN